MVRVVTAVAKEGIKLLGVVIKMDDGFLVLKILMELVLKRNLLLLNCEERNVCICSLR
jgi:hypothetical protein